MNASRLATRLSWILDFIALAALAGTGEVRLELFVVAGALFLIRRFDRVRIPERFVMSALAMLVLLAIGAWLRFRFHPILAASYLAPLVHSVLFLAPPTARYRGWRIGVGFVQLILASALAPDAYLFPAIFGFVLIAAVAVSCGFLDEQLANRAPERREEPLPGGFVRSSLTLAFLIFLSSVIIFPVLPRMKVPGNALDSFKVGYTEHVELSEKRGLNGREGTGEPVLRLYERSGIDLSKEIFLGLIRGRSLDIFDGQNWIASSRRAKMLGIQYVKPSETRDALWVEADRSPLRTRSLPVPYGTLQVQSGQGVEDSPYPRSLGGEWMDALAADARVRFIFAFQPYQKHLRHVSLNEDPPTPSDLSVPDVLKTARMERLEKSIFSDAKGELEKVDRLTAFFVREHFSANLGDASGDSSLIRDSKIPVAERMHPMERFLFLTREGHCEWFASSSVVLLRMAGVPSRLVSGFRISKGPVGGVLTLTTNDAHAWVEYWSPAKGWTALDPTPRLFRPSSFLNLFRDGYEWVSAYWFRYVLNFTEARGEKPGQEKHPEPSVAHPARMKLMDIRGKMERIALEYRSEILLGLLALLVSSFALYLILRWRFPWIFSIRHRVREGGPLLRKERSRMERLILRRISARSMEDAIKLLVNADQPALMAALNQWQENYQRLRFGLSESQVSAADCAALKQQYQSVKSALRSMPFGKLLAQAADEA